MSKDYFVGFRNLENRIALRQRNSQIGRNGLKSAFVAT